MQIDGQLSTAERALLTETILQSPRPPNAVLEVGTWLGGGSTLHILRALHKNACGHLWGIEADATIYERMIGNLRAAAPETIDRFTPLFGFSQQVIPLWLADQGEDFQIDVAFLDGGNNPMEQIIEFNLIEDRIPIGGILMAHDARMRKGKWLVPYVSRLDNWHSTVHNLSEVGLFWAQKVAAQPSAASRQSARNHLRGMRLQPTELAAVLLPRPLRSLVCKLLPRQLSARLTAPPRQP